MEAPDLSLSPARPVRPIGVRETPSPGAQLARHPLAVVQPRATSGDAASRSRARRRLRVIVGTFTAAAVGVMAYSVYRTHWTDAPANPESATKAESPVRPIGQQATIEPAHPAEAAKGVEAGSRAAPAAAAAAGSPGAGAASCTEAIAALGLCTPPPPQGNQTQDVATGPETRARPSAKNAAPLCAEGAMALGLCAPKPAGRTE